MEVNIKNTCYEEQVFSQNSYVKTGIPNLMVFGSGAFER